MVQVDDFITVYISGKPCSGIVSALDRDGFWLTKDLKYEDFIAFIDVEKVTQIRRIPPVFY